MKKRYSMTEDQCYCSIIEFFDNVAKLCGETGDISRFTYDCRKICVTKPVYDQIHKYYLDTGCSDDSFGMFWAIYGPKANLDGDTSEVEIEDGFIIRG